jgi:hypothetical protein
MIVRFEDNLPTQVEAKHQPAMWGEGSGAGQSNRRLADMRRRGASGEWRATPRGISYVISSGLHTSLIEDGAMHPGTIGPDGVSQSSIRPGGVSQPSTPHWVTGLSGTVWRCASPRAFMVARSGMALAAVEDSLPSGLA